MERAAIYEFDAGKYRDEAMELAIKGRDRQNKLFNYAGWLGSVQKDTREALGSTPGPCFKVFTGKVAAVK